MAFWTAGQTKSNLKTSDLTLRNCHGHFLSFSLFTDQRIYKMNGKKIIMCSSALNLFLCAVDFLQGLLMPVHITSASYFGSQMWATAQ